MRASRTLNRSSLRLLTLGLRILKLSRLLSVEALHFLALLDHVLDLRAQLGSIVGELAHLVFALLELFLGSERKSGE